MPAQAKRMRIIFPMKRPADRNISHGSPPTIKVFYPAA